MARPSGNRMVWPLALALALACAVAVAGVRAAVFRVTRLGLTRSIQQHGLYVERILATAADPADEIRQFYTQFDGDELFASGHGGFLAFRREGDRLIPIAATLQVRDQLSPAGLAALEPGLVANAGESVSTWVVSDYQGVERMVVEHQLGGSILIVQLLQRSIIEGPLLRAFGAGGLAVCAVLGLLLWSLWQARLGLADSRRALERETTRRGQLLDEMHSIVISLDADARVAEWNRSAVRELGLERSDVLGRELAQLPILWDVPVLLAGLERARGESAVDLDPVCVTRADRSTCMLGLTVSSIPGSQGSAAMWLVVGADITLKLKVERELRHAQKMRGIGQLAAGIAHEINTPAQFVGDNLRFVREEIGKVLEAVSTQRRALEAAGVANPAQGLDLEYIQKELPEALDQSLEGILRVAAIVGAMKHLAQPEEEGTSSVDIHEMLETALTVSRNEWKTLAVIERSYAPGLLAVSAVRADLIEVVLHLLVNACHAIADAKREQGVIGVSTAASGPWVEIRVSDNGTGMSDEVRARVFEPFFTTKDVGRGSGQGLAIAYDVVVHKHAGSIHVESEVDVGSTFVVRLPASGS